MRYMVTELNGDFKWRVLERAIGIKGKKGWDRLTQEFIDYVRTELWTIYTDKKSGGFGKWADEECRKIYEAIMKREKS